MDLKEVDILGAHISEHWYYRSKARAVARLLADQSPSTILDVGAGSGFFSRYLLARTSASDAWCVDISYDRDFDGFEAGKPLHFRQTVESVNADCVLLMDVLEHVDDDVGLLQSYVSKVPRGARFLISVPAFQFIWSSHDVFLEHRRRYRLKQLEDVVRRSGLTVKRGAYYFGAVFPLAASLRLAGKGFGKRFGKDSLHPRSQLSRHSPWINSILAAVSEAEMSFMKHNRLAGLTAFCLAEKI